MVMTEKRFELKSIHFKELYVVIYDNFEQRALELSIYELVDMLNEVAQSEYDLKKIGNEIQDKLDELFKVGDVE